MSLEQKSVWAEKYRPSTLKDCILPTFIKNLGEQIIKSGNLPNLMLVGSPGCGKTTFGLALIADMGIDSHFVRSSMGGDESGINALRTNVARFAGTRSLFNDKRKAIIFDEADNFRRDVELAMRNFMDEYTKFCGFIVTCNYPEKIEPAVVDRFTKIDFDALIEEERVPLMKASFLAVKKILQAENVKFDEKVLAELVKESFPSLRGLILFLEGQAAGIGEIGVSALATFQGTTFDDIILALQEKKWLAARNWAFGQSNIRPQMYRKLYNALEEKVVPQALPALVTILNQHEERALKGTDRGMTMLSALTDIMAVPSIKFN